MSRSYKKHAYAGDNKGKWKKRLANSKVRMYLKKYENTLKNNDYKKVHESWDICDYGGLYSWEEYWDHQINEWFEWGYKFYPYPDKEKEYKKWYKMCKMK